ncbi:GAF domain-containing protein [uncultured Clostridium sp.]|uniref:GAF domain-containing protein n=1 Tax=uncultured Clostridium sp. TaxID=59620 RepID=UPI0028E70AF5|nr:GAF domain-containing protein [uncultured Clostridium sp.]
MFDIIVFDGLSEEEKYESMVTMLEGLIKDEKDVITNLANASALINALMDRINWVGFYIIKDGELVLGPFQGMPACTRIKVGKGVCGTAVSSKTIMRIEDVHKFEGHIACDSASNSEIVLPIVKNNEVYGVLDIDSPIVGRFTEVEEKYLVQCMDILNKYIDWELIN